VLAHTGGNADMSKIIYALPAVVAAGALAACGSSGTSSSSSAKPSASATGTTSITATSTNPRATTVTVHASGVINQTGTLTLPRGSGAATIKFVFPNGTLAANASRSATKSVHVANTSCAASQVSGGSYTVNSSSSTGKYSGATGHGNYTLTYGAKLPKKNGKCDLSRNVQPVKGTLRLSILVRGPLTVK
jgi:hypothetical protein